MNYCSQCGSPLRQRVPPHDDRLRYVCDRCQRVHYVNPRVVVGCIPEWQGKILLCRRAIEPRSGFWTLPAGFLEMGETLAEGARRETYEEARARVEILAPFALLDLTRAGQVYLIFRSRLLSDTWGPGEESQEVELIAEEDVPWGEIAFSSIHESLRLFFSDRRKGKFRLHTGQLEPASPGGKELLHETAAQGVEIPC